MNALVTQLGPFGVFLLMVPESACVPVPSEATLLFAGFAVSAGWMSAWMAIAAATAGNLVGSLLSYGIGRAMGGRAVGILRQPLSRCEELFARHGSRAVFVARLLPLARTFVSLPAGWSRVPLLPFVAMTVVGCALWATGFVVVGTIAGSAWVDISGIVGKLVLGGTGVAILIALRTRRHG